MTTITAQDFIAAYVESQHLGTKESEEAATQAATAALDSLFKAEFEHGMVDGIRAVGESQAASALLGAVLGLDGRELDFLERISAQTLKIAEQLGDELGVVHS